MPRISIIMSVFNQENFLSEAIDSILKQTYRDFELLIVNDGSTDRSKEILTSFNDKRIRILDNQVNKGLIYSLNYGLDSISDSEYVVRMDSDDIALPAKLEKQVAFMEKNPETGLLGTAIRFFGEGVKETDFYYPETDKKIVSTFLYYNPFAHPTVMIRRLMMTENFRYDTNYPKYEDYALWITMIKKCKFHNLNEVLLKYRRHNSNVTGSYNHDLHSNQLKVLSILNLYKQVTGINLNNDDLNTISIITNRERFEIDLLISVGQLLATIKKLNIGYSSAIMDIIYMRRLLIRYAVAYLLNLNRKKDAFNLIKAIGATKDVFVVGASLALNKSIN